MRDNGLECLTCPSRMAADPRTRNLSGDDAARLTNAATFMVDSEASCGACVAWRVETLAPGARIAIYRLILIDHVAESKRGG